MQHNVLAALLVVSSFGFAASPAMSDPICYMIDSSGSTVDLTALCGRSKVLNSSTSVTASVPNSARQNIRRIVYTRGGLQTYLDLTTFTEYDVSREASIEREFSDGMKEMAKVRLNCPENKLRVTQATTYGPRGNLISSRTGSEVRDSAVANVRPVEDGEESAIAYFLCANTEASIQKMIDQMGTETDRSGTYTAPSRSSSTNSSSGRCQNPWDRDARGNRCGDRAASRRPGGR